MQVRQCIVQLGWKYIDVFAGTGPGDNTIFALSTVLSVVKPSNTSTVGAEGVEGCGEGERRGGELEMSLADSR